MRVRIIGIDTPETVDPRKPVQCFGVEASNAMRDRLDGASVALVIDPDGDTVDTYGRLIRYVMSPDMTVDHGAEMIRDGYAYAYLKYPFSPVRMAEYAKLESQARSDARGLWAPGACGEDVVVSGTAGSPEVSPDNATINDPQSGTPPSPTLPSDQTPIPADTAAPDRELAVHLIAFASVVVGGWSVARYLRKPRIH